MATDDTMFFFPQIFVSMQPIPTSLLFDVSIFMRLGTHLEITAVNY